VVVLGLVLLQMLASGNVNFATPGLFEKCHAVVRQSRTDWSDFTGQLQDLLLPAPLVLRKAMEGNKGKGTWVGEFEIDAATIWQFCCRAGLAAMVCALVSVTSDGLYALPVHADVILNVQERSTVNLFKRNTPGVVFITNTGAYAVDGAEKTEMFSVPSGSGSGWVYDRSGHIITNYHVIVDANELMVKFIEGTEVPAKVIGVDPGTDVAVLEVSLPADKKSLLQPLQRGKSSPLSVGQEVFAIGNPFGLDHTLTKGIVSGVGRTILSLSGRPIQNVIQTDASINPGNSGGPLLNSQGEVIGMNTVIISPSGASAGVGFAIPSDTIGTRAASILKYGYVKRASLGVYLGQDGVAKKLCGQGGGLVAGLQGTSAAGLAGITPGDIITQVGKRSVKRINDIFIELDDRQPGDIVGVTLLRPITPPTDESLGKELASYKELKVNVKLLEAERRQLNTEK